MKRVIIFLTIMQLSLSLSAQDWGDEELYWIDEHVDETIFQIIGEVPSADHLPLPEDLLAERLERQNMVITPVILTPAGTIEEPRIENQRVEIPQAELRHHEPFETNFNTPELEHARGLEVRNLSTQAHAAYNRAIDVAGARGNEQLLHALLARAGFFLRHRDLVGAESDYRAAMDLVPFDQRYALADFVAREYALQGFWEESLPWYSRRIAADPRSAAGYTERAYAFVKLNRYRTALLDYDMALTLTNDLYTIQRIEFEKAKLYFALGEFERADASFARAPQTAPYLRIRTEFYRSQNRMDDAIEAHRRLLQDEPRFASDFALRGEWHALREEFSEALADFDRAVEIAPNDPSVFARRAHFFKARREFESALYDYSRAIELDPDAAYRYAERGRLLHGMELYELAIADFSRAIDLEPTRAFRFNERAHSLQRRGQLQLALNDYAQALRLDPGNVTAQRGWAVIQQQRDIS